MVLGLLDAAASAAVQCPPQCLCPMPSRRSRVSVIRRPRPASSERAHRAAPNECTTTRRGSRKAAPGASRAAGASSTRTAPRKTAEAPRPTFARLSDAPVDLLQRVTYRYPWVDAVRSRPSTQSVADALRERARLTGVPSEDIPKRSTVLTWVSRFERWGREGLLDGVRADAGAKRAITRLGPTRTVTPASMDELIGTIVCGAKGRTVDVVEVLNARLKRRGVTIAYSTVWRWVDAWRRRHPHDVHFAHEGEGAFAEDARLHLGMAPIAPGVMHSFDSSPADEQVRVRDLSVPEGWRLERPIVTRVIDVGSRAALSFEVSIGAVSSHIVRGVLRRCYCPGENWEGLPTVPLPRTARADTGPEHRGAVKAVLEAFNLSTDGPPLPPEARAHVERLHRTLGELTSRAQLGRTTTGRFAAATDGSTREHARTRRARVREERRIELPLMAFRTLDDFIEGARLAHVAYNRSAHAGVARDLGAKRPRRHRVPRAAAPPAVHA